MKAIVMSLVAAVSLLILSLPYDAAADCSDKTSLSATSDGAALAASVLAYVRSVEADAQQTFAVQVNVDVPDGTQLSVFTNGQPVGMITVALGIGTLDLSVPLTPGIDSVCSIGPVWVTDAGQTTTFLIGSF